MTAAQSLSRQVARYAGRAPCVRREIQYRLDYRAAGLGCHPSAPGHSALWRARSDTVRAGCGSQLRLNGMRTKTLHTIPGSAYPATWLGMLGRLSTRGMHRVNVRPYLGYELMTDQDHQRLTSRC